jgi:hypothetical protein
MHENDALGSETAQRPPIMPGGEIEQTPARTGPTGSEPLLCRPVPTSRVVFYRFSVAVVDDMPAYKHTQADYMTAGTLGAVALLTALTNRERRGWVRTLVAGGHAVAAVLFSSLTVIVEGGTLRFYFGPGFWERRIPLDDVQCATSVRTSPIHGWGIHYTSHGWLYNVSGLDAVEVETSSETLRIGTDEPERFRQAIGQAQSGPSASS